MKIYIDEAGSFIPPKGNRRFSLVLALVVPATTEAALFYEFLRLRDDWPEKGVEIKGSKLNEKQAAQVMNLLAAHQVIAEYHAIDMSLHPDDVIEEFKERQAAALTTNLTLARRRQRERIRRIHLCSPAPGSRSTERTSRSARNPGRSPISTA